MSSGRIAKFYHSKNWKRCRDAYLQSTGGLCENCLSRGLITPAEIVHHKEHLRDETFSITKALDFDNLQALCRKCHGEAHKNPRPKRYEILSDGSVFLFEESENNLTPLPL